MSDISVVIAVAVAWLTIGLVLSVVMGRRGHNSFGWLVIGTLLGPLAVVLALFADEDQEHLEPRSVTDGAPARGGTGPVSVLVGYDGSTESAAAVDAVVELLGERLGRLTVATVVPYGTVDLQEQAPAQRLRNMADRMPAVSELQVLHGHPSAALRQFATEGGFELIAVGTRGAGITKAILGSAASELARDSKVPVLLVGGPQA